MNDEINQHFNETKDILKNVNNDLASEYATWIKDKAKIKFAKKIPLFAITSNYIYWCNLGVSKLRIISPFRIKGNLVKITLNDWNKINSAMKKYYTMTKWQ